MVSTELAPDNDNIDHGALLVSSFLPSSPNDFTGWENASPMAAISWPEPTEGNHIVPVDVVSIAMITEVATPTVAETGIWQAMAAAIPKLVHMHASMYVVLTYKRRFT
jgi:hypothetical protein